MSSKKCHRCQVKKPVSDFSRSSKYSDGLQLWCKDCWREYRKSHYQGEALEKERERGRQKNRRYREENPEKIRAYKRARVESGAAAEYSRRRYYAHLEEMRAYARAWYHANRTKVLSSIRGRRRKIQAYQRAWRWANVDRQRQVERLKSAKRRGVIIANGVEPVDVEAIIARDGLRCHLCGKPVDRDKVSLDHLIPVSKGGPHASWNLAIAHLSCNAARSNRGDAQLRLPVT